MEDHNLVIRNEKLKKTKQQFYKPDGRRTITLLTHLDTKFIVLKHYWQSNMLKTSGNNSGNEQYNLNPDLKCSFHILPLNQLTR